MQNKRTWQAAVEAGMNSGTVEEGWRHLGFVLHLLQDLTSPAHVRSDAHPHATLKLIEALPDPDPLEFGEYKKLIPSPQLPERPPVSIDHPEQSAEQLFEELKDWTQSRFFSKDTVFAEKTKGDDPLAGPPFDSISESDQFVRDRLGRRIAYFAMTGDEFIQNRGAYGDDKTFALEMASIDSPDSDSLLISWIGSATGTDYLFDDGTIPLQPTPPLSRGDRLLAGVSLAAPADQFDNFYRSPFAPSFQPGAAPPAFAFGNFFAGSPKATNTNGRIETFGVCEDSKP